MTQQNQTKQEIVKSLVHNYGFKKTSYDSLPTIDFVYPSHVQECNREDFRFSNEVRRKLASRANIVREDLKNKELIWTNNPQLVMEADSAAPRIGFDAIINGKINSVYSLYSPMLLLGFGENGEKDFSAYPVKAIPLDYRIGGQMFWHELKDEESKKLYETLSRKAEEKPYKNLMQMFRELFGSREK